MKAEGTFVCKASWLVQCALDFGKKHASNFLYQNVFDKWSSNIWHYWVIYLF